MLITDLFLNICKSFEEYNDDVNLYGVIAEGFRSGGVNRGSPVELGAPTEYDEEKLLSYEIGIKSTLADHRVIANAALFYNDWRDKPTSSDRGRDRVPRCNRRCGKPAQAARNRDRLRKFQLHSAFDAGSYQLVDARPVHRRPSLIPIPAPPD